MPHRTARTLALALGASLAALGCSTPPAQDGPAKAADPVPAATPPT